MRLPQITCVIPTLNSARTLEATLTSLTYQGGVELRIHVVDSGSTDATLAICEKWEIGHSYVPPGNMYSAINAGLEKATTPWVTYLNSDDVLYGRSYARLIAEAETAGAEVAYGDVDFIDLDGRFLSSMISGRPEEILPLFRLGIMAFPQPGTIFSRSLYARLDGFDTKYRFGADADFFVRAALSGASFAALRVPVCAFRLHGAQQTARNLDAFEEEKRRLYAITGPARLTDRLAKARWRARNLSNYGLRAFRVSRLRGRLTLSFLSQIGDAND